MPTLEEVSFPDASSQVLTVSADNSSAVWTGPTKGSFFTRPITADETFLTGEDYSEPVAWAKLLGVNIARYGTGGVLLANPGNQVGLFPTCSPAVLTRLVKLYAEAVGMGRG